MIGALVWRGLWHGAAGASGVLIVGAAAPPDHAIALAWIALVSSITLGLIGAFGPILRDIVRERRKDHAEVEQLRAELTELKARK